MRSELLSVSESRVSQGRSQWARTELGWAERRRADSMGPRATPSRPMWRPRARCWTAKGMSLRSRMLPTLPPPPRPPASRMRPSPRPCPSSCPRTSSICVVLSSLLCPCSPCALPPSREHAVVSKKRGYAPLSCREPTHRLITGQVLTSLVGLLDVVCMSAAPSPCARAEVSLGGKYELCPRMYAGTHLPSPQTTPWGAKGLPMRGASSSRTYCCCMIRTLGAVVMQHAEFSSVPGESGVVRKPEASRARVCDSEGAGRRAQRRARAQGVGRNGGRERKTSGRVE